MFQLIKFPRTAAAISAAALISGAAVLVAQQQAAEAPATARTFYTRPAVAAVNGIVTTGHPIASSAGLQMLLKGGNAFDAAVAVGAMAGLGEPRDERHRRQRLHDDLRQEERQGALAVDGGRGAEGVEAGGDDAGDAERRHEGRHRPRQPRRLPRRCSIASAR